MSEITSNREAHHTDVFHNRGMIVRRGQSFRINLTFNQETKDWKSIIFTAQTGPPVTGTSKTKVVFPVSGYWHSGSWGAVLEASPENSMRVIITSPANAVIGRYELSVEITFNDLPTTHILGNFILLFNPWSPDDEVYLADEDERQEYVLNESGIIYMGNENNVTGFGWNYGQFEQDILNVCLDILDRNINYLNDPVKDCAQRSDAAYVGRVVSAMVNSNDESGVLEGRWEKDFPDGADPTSWSGSVEILLKWQKDGYIPVKYGQCWVFAGVMCTVLRCLGIPTRLITNFLSAHNTDANLSIDLYYDSNGKFLDDVTEDSIWNFHVWNESWFIRRDLGHFYDGWQVIDSTPQEESAGLLRCGPSSVKAVKEGDVNLIYDTPFVFAEVNADRTTWVYYSKDKKEQVYSDTKSVGQSMSTKAVGSDERVDVTDNYKYPEGSVKEREIFNKALQLVQAYGPAANEATEVPTNVERQPERTVDVRPRMRPARPAPAPRPQIYGKFRLTAPAVVGEDISLVLNITNQSSERKNVEVKMSCFTLLYTGRRAYDISTTYKFVTIGPQSETNVPLVIFYSEYGRVYANNTMIGVSALCEVENGEKLLVRRDINLDSPAINIRFPDSAVLYEPVVLEVRFANPLTLTVEDCILLAEGSGLIDGQVKAVVPPMRPREKVQFKLEVIPWKSGARQLQVHFSSKHFSLKGFKTVVVKPW